MINIYLTGFMGAGKTSVGRELAVRLGRPFVDLDAAIVSATGRSITDIFAQDGEVIFREFETRKLESVAALSAQVVATGGGVVIAECNRRLMQRTGVIVNLTVSHSTIKQRLVGDDTRPLLQGNDSEDRVSRLLAEREPFYAQADLIVSTDGKSVDDIATEILAQLVDKYHDF